MASNLACATIEVLGGKCTCLDGAQVTGVIGAACGSEDLPPRGLLQGFVPCSGIAGAAVDCSTLNFGQQHRWLTLVINVFSDFAGVAKADFFCNVWGIGGSSLCLYAQAEILNVGNVTPTFQSNDPLMLVYEFDFDLPAGISDCQPETTVSFRVTITRGGRGFFEPQVLPTEYEVEMSGWSESGVSCEWQDWWCNTDRSAPEPKKYLAAANLNGTFPLKVYALVAVAHDCGYPQIQLPSGTYRSIQTAEGTGLGCPGAILLSDNILCFPTCPNNPSSGNNFQAFNESDIRLGWRGQLYVPINNGLISDPGLVATYDPPADWDDWKDDGTDMTFTLSSFAQTTHADVTPPSTVTVRRTV